MVMMDHPPLEDTIMRGDDHQAYGEPNGFINPQDLFRPPPPGPPSPPVEHPQPSLSNRDEFYPGIKALPTPEYESVDGVEVQEKPRRLLSTGCCYDERMKLHTNADFNTEHHHPEDPRRIQAIFQTFVKHRLVYLGDEAKLAEILYNNPTKYMCRIQARFATQEEITTVHTHEHYDWVYKTSTMEIEALREYSEELDQGRKSVYLGTYTHLAAMVSAGGAIETCKQVMAGNVKNAIALIRPPGHHAEAHEAMGFCFFNNVPIAIRVCQADFPETCRKVMILDWDVHHGNGTQNIFYDDPNVLYISLHVWMDGAMYPGLPDDPQFDDAGHASVGRGRGVGKNVNIPWKDKGMGDAEYMAAFQRIVMPIAQEFAPDLVIVSAGFDAAVGDTLGGCFVTPACYSQMTHMLMSLANGKLAVILEGGYDLKAISRSALAVGKTLMGEPPQPMEIPPISDSAARILRKVQQAHAPYWECMRPKKVDWKYELRHGSIKSYSAIRAKQYTSLRDNYKMLEMFVNKEDLAKTMKHQILFTPKITEAKKIFLIIHDPPTTRVDHQETEGAVDPANIWHNDPVRPYIDWAVNNGFGIIDINIPTDLGHDIDDDEDPVENVEFEKRKIAEHRQRVRDAIVYVWDNYLEEHETDNIVVMAVGGAYGAIKELLVTRPEARHSITVMLSFVPMTNPLISVTLGQNHVDNHEMEQWYGSHSCVFAAHNHPVWSSEKDQRRIRKKGRWGDVRQCPPTDQPGVNAQMEWAYNKALKWVDSETYDPRVVEGESDKDQK